MPLSSSPTAYPPSAPRSVLIPLALAMILPSLGASIATVALPRITQTLNTSFDSARWVILAYLLAMTLFIVGAGRLGDLLGHRRVLLTCLSLFTLGSALCALAPTLWTLVAARGLQGMGGAGLLALTPALIRETVPRERVGRAMGLLGTLSAVGTALGPSLGGFLIDGLGWRSVFLALVPLGTVALVLAPWIPPRDRERPETPSKKAPPVPLDILGDAPFVAGMLGNALVATVMMTTLLVGPFYLTLALGLTETEMGLVLALSPLLSILSGVPAGRIVDRLGAPVMVPLGLLGMTIGCLALALLPPLLGVPGYVLALVPLAPSYQLFQAANTTAALADAPSDRRGVLSGLLGLARNLGFISGASVMGALFATAAGTADMTQATPEAVTNGLRAAFLTAAGLLCIGLILSRGARHLRTSTQRKDSHPPTRSN